MLFKNNQHFIAEVGKTFLAHERYEKIVDLLRKNKAIKVPSATKLFRVSTETVRWDLEHGEIEGLPA
ncbi:DeoR family transcriptional regulator [Cytobacillus horneckiae]|uniref:DeoR family transcriptional regulator n=1 Tax=Cytobacillus horneckiae TaxID=549687 RepID=UPI003D9A9446